MAPVASTSKAGSAGGGGGAAGGGNSKLTLNEKKLIEIGLAAAKGVISQDELFKQGGMTAQATEAALNGILRKNLAQLMRTGTGRLEFRFIGKDEAKAMGSMDSEEKLVLDHIKDADNKGIWTKFLHNKTGLPRTTINKVLKVLEGRKVIKTVKSVKHPTRKIYMMTSIVPSVELTGGPWFTDNELDAEFVEALKHTCFRFLEKKTRPKKVKTKDLAPGEMMRLPVWPASGSPYLPRVRDVLDFIMTSGIAVGVDLNEEHVEALLELMIYEGSIERILVQTPENDGKGKKKGSKSSKAKKRKRAASSDEDSGSDDDRRSKSRRKKKGRSNGKSKKGNKKRRLDSNALDDDDDDDDAPSSASEEFDSDEDSDNVQRRRRQAQEDDTGNTKSSRRQKVRIKKSKVKKERNGASDSDASMDSATSESSSSDKDDEDDDEELGAGQREGGVNDYVYRCIREYHPVIGWTDMPCGKCPVESFCTEPPRNYAASASTTSGSSIPPATRRSAFLNAGAARRGLPKVGVELEGGIKGVGMIGGAGAAIGVSTAKWGETKGAVGSGVAPVNPKDCQYFKKWLDF